MDTNHIDLTGAGLGLRRSFITELAASPPEGVGFYEVAPENWIKLGGAKRKLFDQLVEDHDFVCHGLSLSIGGPAPLNQTFIQELKVFLDAHHIACYSEHLSYCSDDGYLYDLMPLPFTDEAVHYVSDRILQVQDMLERPVIMENISYYAAPGQQMSELDFINAVLDESGCQLLLDVNNVYVNSVNHNYDPHDFISKLPSSRIAYGHMAGHYVESDDLIIDTHGADVVDPVWELLDFSYSRHGVFPTLLERDFNLPALEAMLCEVQEIRQIQQRYQSRSNAMGIQYG